MRLLLRPRAWSSKEVICGVPRLIVPVELPVTVVLPAESACVSFTSGQGDWRMTHVEAAVSCMHYCVKTTVPSQVLPVALRVMQPVLVRNKHGPRIHMIVINPGRDTWIISILCSRDHRARRLVSPSRAKLMYRVSLFASVWLNTARVT